MQELPKQILSGALHYFRIHPALWDDRLDKAAAMGLNTVETYLPWNIHEPHRGEFVFSGIADMECFIRKVKEHDLFLIVRPGPYICAEWDNGGFPGWLLGLPGVELRRSNAVYLEAVRNYFSVLLPKLRPWQRESGGPIIMIQIENEYGSYGQDHDYLAFLRSLYRENGITVPFFTSDGPYGQYPVGGSLPDTLLTVNFGSRYETAFAGIRKMRPGQPDFCMEFWNGWFDHWGEKHQHRPCLDGGGAFATEYEALVASGASVNLYMFHGGTNFGFTAGANGNFLHDYAPVVTSYDYDCPLSECGDPTEKFTACQTILKRLTGNPRIRPVAPTRKILPSAVRFTGQCVLRGHLKELSRRHGEQVTPPTLEELGENFGFIHYRTRLSGCPEATLLRLFDVNDYAQVWRDGKYLGSRFRERGEKPFEFAPIPPEGCELELLVENSGRINYGPFIGREKKGIAGSACLDFQQQFHWEYDLIPMESPVGLSFAPLTGDAGPATFYRGTFELQSVGEAFLARPGRKGCAWINGFPLGRYWEIGPTETLYVPSGALRCGTNELIVFEQEELLHLEASFSPAHELGAMEED